MRIATAGEIITQPEKLLEEIRNGEKIYAYASDFGDGAFDWFCGSFEDVSDKTRKFYECGGDVEGVLRVELTDIDGCLCGGDVADEYYKIDELYDSLREYEKAKELHEKAKENGSKNHDEI